MTDVVNHKSMSPGIQIRNYSKGKSEVIKAD